MFNSASSRFLQTGQAHLDQARLCRDNDQPVLARQAFDAAKKEFKRARLPKEDALFVALHLERGDVLCSLGHLDLMRKAMKKPALVSLKP